MSEPRNEQDRPRPEDADPTRGGDEGGPANEGTGEQASERAQEAGRAAGEEAERIAAEGEDVRERVRRLVVETLEARSLSLDELNEVSRQVLEGAAAGVNEVTPEQQRTVLRSVIDGLADSYATAANATRLALEEANARRRAFAEEDLAHAMREIRALDERFLRMVTRTTGRAWGTLTEQASSLSEHARRAAQSIRPSMEEALRAARRQPGRLASEAASAGVEVSRHATGRLLQAMAGLLQGAGEALAGTKDKGGEKQREKRDDEDKDTAGGRDA